MCNLQQIYNPTPRKHEHSHPSFSAVSFSLWCSSVNSVSLLFFNSFLEHMQWMNIAPSSKQYIHRKLRNCSVEYQDKSIMFAESKRWWMKLCKQLWWNNYLILYVNDLKLQGPLTIFLMRNYVLAIVGLNWLEYFDTCSTDCQGLKR